VSTRGAEDRRALGGGRPGEVGDRLPGPPEDGRRRGRGRWGSWGPRAGCGRSPARRAPPGTRVVTFRRPPAAFPAACGCGRPIRPEGRRRSLSHRGEPRRSGREWRKQGGAGEGDEGLGELRSQSAALLRRRDDDGRWPEASWAPYIGYLGGDCQGIEHRSNSQILTASLLCSILRAFA
jgi:hypothetical protein